MTLEAYKKALEQAKKDLLAKTVEVGEAEQTVERGTKQIVELRQTIAVLSKLCGEPEYVEEDALGITEVVRLAYKSAAGGAGLSAQDVKERIESMGYAGRWANLLASVHTVTKRLYQKGEIEAAGNINGKDTFRWVNKYAMSPPPEFPKQASEDTPETKQPTRVIRRNRMI